MKTMRDLILIIFLLFPTISMAQRNFFDDQEFFTHENAQVNDLIGLLEGYPYDTLTNVSMYILSGNANNAYKIDNSGNIRVAKTSAFNYSENSEDVLEIQVNCDQGTDITFATINILDPSKTIYIDANYYGTESGSYSQPYNSFSDFTIATGKNYLFKRGTSLNRNDMVSKSNVIWSAYGSGPKPILDKGRYFDGNTNVVVDNIHLKNTGNEKPADVVNNTNLTFNKCIIENDPTIDYGTCIVAARNTNLNVLYTEMFNAPRDAVYGGSFNGITFQNCYIHDVNLTSMNPPSEGQGDGLQIRGGSSDVHILGNFIDRSNGYGKFCIIFEDSQNGILIENNFFRGSKPGFGGAGVYLKPGVSGQYVIRNNIFHGTNHGNTAIWVAESPDVYNNIFIGWSGAIGGASTGNFYHNTFYDNNISIFGADKIINNLFYLSAGQKVFSSTPTKTDRNYANKSESSTVKTSNWIFGGDPLFVDPSGLDFSLQASSPACGNTQSETNIITDKCGVERDLNGADDYGALEISNEGNPGYINYAPNANFIFSTAEAVSMELVTIDASGSSDQNGDALTYNWTFPSEINANLTNPLKPSFDAPTVNEKTDFEVALSVNDGYVNSQYFTQKITINPTESATEPSDTKNISISEKDLTKLTIFSVNAIDDDGNTPEQTIDENISTRWSSEGDGKWIQYELSGFDTIHYIKTAWYNGDNRIASFDIQVSDNLTTWTPVLNNQNTCGTTCELRNTELESALVTKYLRIVGHGNSVNMWNSITEVEIYGISGNDEDPISTNQNPIIQDQAFGINHTMSSNEFVGQVVASDPDASQVINYSITGGNGEGLFKINPTSGEILTNKTVETNISKSITLSITVTDNAPSPLSATANVTISINTMDVNHTPVVSSQTFEINHAMSPDEFVGRAVASDPDASQVINYAITGGNGEGLFKINPTSGEILTNKTIGTNISKSITLSVTVTDNAPSPLSATANVTISINTIAEEPQTTLPNIKPVIQSQAFVINHTMSSNEFIGKVVASDPDASQLINYSITGGNGEGLFQINSTSGEILTNKTIGTNINKSVVLSITVKDNGSIPLSATANVTVSINTMETNQAPVASDQTFEIRKNTKSNDLVGQIIASDPNPGQTLTYSIVAGDSDNQFYVNNTTGEIFTDKSLLLTINQTFVLTVKVTDNGYSPLSTDANITIKVIVKSNLVNGEVNGNNKKRITLYYSQPLQEEGLKSTQLTSAFTINNNSFKNVKINGSEIYLDVDSDFNFDDEIIINYDKDVSAIYDISGNEIESFINYVVENNLPIEEKSDVTTDANFNLDGNVEVSFYPNPSNGFFTAKANNLTADNCIINMYNMSGSLVAKQEVYAMFGSIEEKINVTHLSPGTYIIHFICDTQSAKDKIIIR